MDFYHCLASSDFSCYLCVEPTGNNHRQKLPFVTCQGLKTVAKNNNLLLLLAGPRLVSTLAEWHPVNLDRGMAW